MLVAVNDSGNREYFKLLFAFKYIGLPTSKSRNNINGSLLIILQKLDCDIVRWASLLITFFHHIKTMITVIMSYHVTRNKCVTMIKDDIIKEHFGVDTHFKDSNPSIEKCLKFKWKQVST